MFLYEIFSRADRFSYRAHIISSATCVLILCASLTYLSPFLLTYYTGDFWIKESIYSEQPRINDLIKYVLFVDTNDVTNNRFFMSSDWILNQNYAENQIYGTTSKTASDIDGDGLIDQLRISFNPIFDNSNKAIRNLNILLMFPYELRNRQRIYMETMALVNFVSPYTLRPSSNVNITVYGQLVFEQRIPIKNSGFDVTYNQSIISTDSSLISIPNLDTILSNYFTQNYFTSFKTQYTWITPLTTTRTNALTVNVVVNVGRQAIRFVPGFWQAFKWGWIQYICVLYPFLIVFNRLKLFVFSNQHVRTLAPLLIHRHKA